MSHDPHAHHHPDQDDLLVPTGTEEELGDGQALSTAASEAMIAEKFRREDLKQKPGWRIPGLQELKTGASRIAMAPLNHIWNNKVKIGLVTALGAAGSFGMAALLSQVQGGTGIDINAVWKTAALAYPIYGSMEYAGGRLGHWIGHFNNAWDNDRFQEVKSTPRVKAAFQVAAASIIALGGIFGNQYMDAAKAIVTDAPRVVGVEIPDKVVDHLTELSNTRMDPKWEIEDQAGCLYCDIMDPDRPFQCEDGPGSEFIEVQVGPSTMKLQVPPYMTLGPGMSPG